jgi:MOSC domain-containing protein
MAPVKGLRLVSAEAVELDRAGIRGDRRFYLVDEEGALVNAKRAPHLLTVRAEVEGTRLVLRHPDGSVVEGDVELAEQVETSFHGRPVTGHVVEGPWGKMLSAVAGKQLRLVRTEREGDGHDRGPAAGASLVSTTSLDALASAAGVSGRVDVRRFRMTIGVDGVGTHEEDGWLGRRVQVGGAAVVVRGNTGRCAVTTLDPDRGVSDLDTLGAISAYRGDVPTTERLPFGVWCEVVVPGPVAVGDAVEVE